MNTIETIRSLTDTQIEVSFILLGVYFNKNETVSKQSEMFTELADQGNVALKNEGVIFGDEFNVWQIRDLLKVEMLKRGIR